MLSYESRLIDSLEGSCSCYEKRLNFSKMRGYCTADDIRRAIKTYEKTRELAKKTNNKEIIYECSKAIMLLSADVKETRDSIKGCREICESLYRSRLRSYIKAKLSSVNPTNWFKS
ncbi:MAG: hypothetical protein ACP5IM_00440 [Candidatus Bathyarchaeia archaeon]